MQIRGLLKLFYALCEWIVKLVFLNVLFLLFTLTGVILLGAFPAITSMFVIARKWITNMDVDIPVFKTFWLSYKNNFLRSNIIGYLFLFVGIFLGADYYFIYHSTHSLMKVIYFPLISFSVIYLLLFLYSFPAIQFKVKLTTTFRITFLLMVINPFGSFFLFLGLFVIYYLMFSFPGLIPLFGFSLFVLLITYTANRSFNKIHKLKVELPDFQ